MYLYTVSPRSRVIFLPFPFECWRAGCCWFQVRSYPLSQSIGSCCCIMGPQQRCSLVVNFQAVGNLKVDELRFFFEWQQDLVFIKIIYHSFILIHLDLILGLLGKLWKLPKALLAGEAFCQIERSGHSWNVCVEDYLAFVFKLITPQSQSNIHNSQTIFTCHSYIICMCIVYDIFR